MERIGRGKAERNGLDEHEHAGKLGLSPLLHTSAATLSRPAILSLTRLVKGQGPEYSYISTCMHPVSFFERSNHFRTQILITNWNPFLGSHNNNP